MSGRTEAIRVAVDAINRGDWDAALTTVASDFEYDLTRTASPLAGVYHRAAVRRVAEEFLGSWESAAATGSR